jgi:cytochrome c553
MRLANTFTMDYVHRMVVLRALLIVLTLLALAGASANASVAHDDHHSSHPAAEAEASGPSGADERSDIHATHPCGVCHHMTALPGIGPGLSQVSAPLAFRLEHQSLTGRRASPPHQPPIG